MKALGLEQMDKVDLMTTFNGEVRLAPKFKVVPYNIPSRNIATYFPEANVLVHIDAHDKVSETPSSKFVRVQVKKT
jgi:anaerobic selenocysteine-containing dehydrogenase